MRQKLWYPYHPWNFSRHLFFSLYQNQKPILFSVIPGTQLRLDFRTTVDSTLVGSKILKKGKCICKTIEMCFKGLISVPIYVRSIEKHVRYLVWTFFLEKWIFEKKRVDPPFFLMFSLHILYKQILTKMGSWGWSKLFWKKKF